MKDLDTVKEIVAVLERAAERAGYELLRILASYSERQKVSKTHSVVSLEGIDRRVEEMLLREFREVGYAFLVISEESGILEIGQSPQYILIVDPLDGSNNAICGIPFYTISLGLARKAENPTTDDLIAGVVWDVNEQKSYVAIKGQGVIKPYLPSSKITPKKKGKPIISLYAYGGESIDSAILEIMKFSLIRTLGSVSLEMCFLAQGKIDAFLDVRNLTRIVDIAAGLVILQEAGCQVGRPNGERLINNLTQRTGISLLAARERLLFGKLTQMFK